jgi:hypothetical protein
MRISLAYGCLCALFIAASAQSAQAADDKCAAFSTVPNSGSVEKVVAIPDSLLTNWNTAIECMFAELPQIDDRLRLDRQNEVARSRLLAITAALRKIVTRQSDAGKQGLLDFIKVGREFDNIGVASALTFGATDELTDMRLNSMLVFTNIVDNTTVCVPLTHLNDVTITERKDGVKARANLLGIVTVVAPWAYKENYASIEATTRAVASDVKVAPAGLETTQKIIENIFSRLGSQQPNGNKSANLDRLGAGLTKSCTDYVEGYTPRLDPARRANLQYP